MTHYDCLYSQYLYIVVCLYFFFNDTATTEIYTLSLHDALPILEAIGTIFDWLKRLGLTPAVRDEALARYVRDRRALDRKSTRLNSSHLVISYAVFCLKKKKYNSHECKYCIL